MRLLISARETRRFFIPLCVVLSFAVCATAQTVETKPVPASESKGMPPRSSPTDYAAQAKVGDITIAAEFAGHAVPRPEGSYSTEDYVVIETAFYGPANSRAALSIEDFSLRINGKKNALASSPHGMVDRSLTDPSWVAPDAPEKKSNNGINTGGKGGGMDSVPAPVHVPIELRRAMALYVQKSALPEGDRALPQAGLIFFPYRGKTEGIHSLELIYSGSAGKATINLQP